MDQPYLGERDDRQDPAMPLELTCLTLELGAVVEERSVAVGVFEGSWARRQTEFR